jgi:hypothetical protein
VHVRKRILLVAFAVAVAGMVASATARDGDRTIRCESSGDKATYCRTYTIGRVEIVKQLSRARCDQYDTWGSDQDGGGIWVRNGCRADFVVRERRWDDWGRDRGDRPQTSRIRCASPDWAYNRCGVGGRISDARVSRQISRTRCTRGDNWGIDRSSIWVDRGCEAEFEVR